MCPVSRFDAGDWRILLSFHPELEHHPGFRWDLLPTGEIAMLLRAKPEFAKTVPVDLTQIAETGYLTVLLIEQPGLLDGMTEETFRKLEPHIGFALLLDWLPNLIDHPFIRASLRRNWEDIHRNIEEDDRFRKLPFIRNLIRKHRRECEDGDDEEPLPFFFRRDKVPSPSTEGKAESPAPAPDTGAGWVEWLRAHPEDGAACEWGKLGAEDWIRLLSTNPEWAWRPEWRRLVPEGEWKAFLRERRRADAFRSALPAPKRGRWFRPPAA